MSEDEGVRKARALASSVEVWQDEDAARCWMDRYNAYLGRSPIEEAAKDEEGAQRVLLLLGQLQAGTLP